MKYLIIDTNLAIDHALTLAAIGHKVYYYVDARSPYPCLEDTISGYGFSIIEKIDDFGAVLDEADCVLISDVGYGFLADYLRSEGKAVFCSDARSQKLELDRIWAKKLMQKLDILTPEYTVVEGIENLRKYIKQNPGKHFIKLNTFRGNIESFSVDSLEELDMMLANANFGVMGDIINFCIEKECDGVEVGADIYFNGQDFILPYLYTIEIKGAGNIAKYTNNTSHPIFKTFLKLKNFLSQNGYHGNISVEGFLNSNGEYRVIDWTCRLPFPGSAIFCKAIENYDEVVYKVASGKSVEPILRYPYWVQVGIYAGDSEKWRKLHFPLEVLPFIGFRRVVKKSNDYYYVPGDSLVCTLTGFGYDLEMAMNTAIDAASKVSIFDVDIPMGIVSIFKPILKKLKEEVGDASFDEGKEE